MEYLDEFNVFDSTPCLLDLPLDALELVARRLSTRDRMSLALTCKQLWQRMMHSGAFWSSLALTASNPSLPAQFLAWVVLRQHLLQELHIWEPFLTFAGHTASGITAASLTMLQQLQAPALASLVWNVMPSSSLVLAGLHLPGLVCLELDWMDVHDITATVAIPAGFASGLPHLTSLAISNVADVRMAPASLPASLRCLSFENAYSALLVPTLAAAVQSPASGGCSCSDGGLEVLQIRNMERRGIALSLEGLEALAPSLTSLLLHHPYQPDPLPGISALTALQQLTVSHANVTVGVEGLARITSLTALALPSCALQVLPAAIWILPQLQALDIGENYLHGGLPGSVADARSLTSLCIDLQYASEGGMQLGRLPPTLRSLTLLWKPADLPARLCGVLPHLRELSSSLRALELARSSVWHPGGPSTSLRDCPAVVSGLEELAAASGQLTISLSRY